MRQSPVLIALILIALLTGIRSGHAQLLPPTPALQSEHRLESLQQDLEDIFEDPNFSNAHWGITVQSLETGQYIFRRNDTRSFIPASNQKLFTTSMALSTLGPDFTYTTQLVTDGKISNRTLTGDLVIRGAGDPTFGSPSLNSDKTMLATFEAWADSLERLGITKIVGDIIGDDSYFTSQRYPYGWAIEDIPYYFAMQTSGLSFGENKVTVKAWPAAKVGVAPKYSLSPETEYIDILDQATTKADSITIKLRKGVDSTVVIGMTTLEITRDQGKNVITMTGEIPKSGDTVREQISVEDPTLFATEMLREVLEDRGIEVRGKTLTQRDLKKKIPYLKTRVLAYYTSPPLDKIIAQINERSNNHFAEQVYLTVAKEKKGEGSWDKGAEAMKEFVSSIGIDPQKMSTYDGSGLSRMDLVSPMQIVTLLRHMYQKKNLFAALYPSLSVMGVDGTVSTRLRDTKAQGNIRAKTGFLTGVRTISGYLTTADGEMLAFSILANNYTTPVSLVNNLQDLVLLRLVNFSRK
jgi:D-alanyl-D-alanine carboxypeptidase/D-alanyl-D-alanine-endopeptidase (penicillin-binding protein 4)